MGPPRASMFWAGGRVRAIWVIMKSLCVIMGLSLLSHGQAIMGHVWVMSIPRGQPIPRARKR